MENEHYRIKDFIPRSVGLTSNRIYLCGSPSSGKTTLALSLDLAQFICYINLSLIPSKKFINEAKDKLLNLDSTIKLIVIDGYQQGFLDNVLLSKLNIAKIILIGKHSIYKQDLILRDFSYIVLRNLSFEEYLAGDRKKLGIESLFANFIEFGNAPDINQLKRFQREQRRWQIMKLGLEENFSIFQAMLSFQSIKITTNSLYTQLKSYIQISKDRLYPLIENLRDEHIIFICEHSDNVNYKSKKYKLYFYDFSLYALADNRHFLRMYENMVYLELIARGFVLSYDDDFDFLDERMEIFFLCMPFASIENIELRIANLSLIANITKKQIIIISMNLNKRLSDNVVIIDFTSLYSLSC